MIATRLRAALTVGFVLLISQAASADDPSPGTYGVVLVERSDKLNMRASPSASAEIVGEIPFDGVGIVALRSTEPEQSSDVWTEIRYNGRTGWVNARYLSLTPGRGGGMHLPGAMQCFGTEPFWGIRIVPGTLTFDWDLDKRTYTITRGISGYGDYTYYLVDSKGDAGTLSLLIHQGACSDGMSETEHQYSVAAMFDDAGLFTGCCSPPAGQ